MYLFKSHHQAPPSHEEKRSGELSPVSWASTHFCNSVTYIAIFKTFLLNKGTDTRVEIKKLYCCKGSST